MRRSHSFHPDCEMMEDRLVMSTVPGHLTVSDFAIIDLAKPKPKPKPAAPSFTANPISSTQVNLSWTKVSGASKYLIEESVKGKWVQLATMNKKSTGYTISGLKPDTNYTFDVVYVKGGHKYWETPKSADTFTATCPWVIDHPVAVDAYGRYYNYAVINGTLFGPNGPVYTDVHQGEVGDCWLLASFAEAAARAPQDITRMFTDLGIYMENGVQVHCWSVHFYNNYGALTSVIVDNELPVNSYGYTMADQVTNGVLWVALAEKAFIEAGALGYIRVGFNCPDSYESISGGAPYWALGAITGAQAGMSDINTSQIDAVFSAGGLVVICTPDYPTDSKIAGDHSYALIADNANATWQYTVYNPWGEPSITTYYGATFYCNATEISQNFEYQFWDWA